MTEPVITACMCTGEPRPILDEAGMPMLVEGVIVCPHCGRNPFGYREPANAKYPLAGFSYPQSAIPVIED